MGIGKGTRQVGHLIVGLQHLTNHLWHLVQSLDNLEILLAVDGSLGLSQCQRKHRKHSHLTGKGLRRGYTYLWSYMDVSTCIGSTRNRRTDGITDAIDESALLLSELDGSQRIGCLTTLRDGDHHIVLRHNRIAIAELRSILHLDGNTTQRLDNLLADESGMPGSTASHNDDALSLQQLTTVVNQSRQGNMVTFHIDTSTHTVGQTFGLLEDFLQHEVGITTLLNLAEVDVYLLDSQLLLLAQDTDYFQFLTQTNNGNVAILQIDHLISIFDDRTGITTQEELTVANANHQRTLLAGSDNLAGITLVDNGNGISTDDLIEGYLNGLQQRELLLHHDILHQLHQHLGIGIRLEMDAFLDKLRLDVGIVLNDAIVDNSQVMTFRIVRMRITARGLTMCCPASVRNTNGTTHVLVITIFY